MKKWFSSVSTLEELKKAYRKLAVKLHPDNGGNVNDFSSMQNEYDNLYQKLYHTKGQKAEKQDKKASYEDIKREADFFKDIIDRLMKYDGINIDIVGSWLWVYGKTFDCKDTLKELNFQWAKGKKKWYYTADAWQPSTKKRFNYEEIKAMHGATTVKVAKEEDKKKTVAIA